MTFKTKDVLVYHPESDDYYRCTQAEYDRDSLFCYEDLNDVTGIEHHEEEYKKRMKEKSNESIIHRDRVL